MMMGGWAGWVAGGLERLQDHTNLCSEGGGGDEDEGGCSSGEEFHQEPPSL